MAGSERTGISAGSLRFLGAVGGRATSVTLRPVVGAFGAASEVGINLQRRVVASVVNSEELEQLVSTALSSARVQAALVQATRSKAVQQLVDAIVDNGMAERLMDRLLDSGTLDRFFVRLLSSEGLWQLIDEVSASEAVTAAISQQGLSFADQVGGELRRRSRKADDRIERAAQLLIHRRSKVDPNQPNLTT